MKKINGFTLKIIAYFFMVIDHIGIRLSIMGYDTDIMRFYGRITFPIIVFLLMKGFMHTKNFKKYLLRLFIVALISEIPFDLLLYNKMFDFSYQNVLFELIFILLMYKSFTMIKTKDFGLKIIIDSFIIIIFSIITELLRLDYGMIGIIIGATFYFVDNKKLGYIALIVVFLIIGLFNDLAFGKLLSIPLILMYKSERPPKFNRYLYLFYPVHLLILYLLL